MIGKVSLVRKWVRMIYLQRILNNVSIVLSHCLHEIFNWNFGNGWLLVIRNESLTITLSGVISDLVEETTLLSKRENLNLKIIIDTVWYDIHGILYFELLDNNKNIDADLYCQPFENVHPYSKERGLSSIIKMAVFTLQKWVICRPFSSLSLV